MKRKTDIFFLFFAASLALFVFSCKKKQGATTVAGMLQGKWKLTQIADGDNTKGNPLAFSPLDKAEDWEWTFNSNGKGIDIESWNSQAGITENFSYIIFPGDSLWWATTTHDTATYYISVINADYMIWTRTFTTDTNTVQTIGYYFNRN